MEYILNNNISNETVTSPLSRYFLDYQQFRCLKLPTFSIGIVSRLDGKNLPSSHGFVELIDIVRHLKANIIDSETYLRVKTSSHLTLGAVFVDRSSRICFL